MGLVDLQFPILVCLPVLAMLVNLVYFANRCLSSPSESGKVRCVGTGPSWSRIEGVIYGDGQCVSPFGIWYTGFYNQLVVIG
jgi:hypothetical protein